MTTLAPMSQIVTFLGPLDLNNVCAKVGQIGRQHVASDQP
jgi:hypothetical protein